MKLTRSSPPGAVLNRRVEGRDETLSNEKIVLSFNLDTQSNYCARLTFSWSPHWTHWNFYLSPVASQVCCLCLLISSGSPLLNQLTLTTLPLTAAATLSHLLLLPLWPCWSIYKSLLGHLTMFQVYAMTAVFSLLAIFCLFGSIVRHSHQVAIAAGTWDHPRHLLLIWPCLSSIPVLCYMYNISSSHCSFSFYLLPVPFWLYWVFKLNFTISNPTFYLLVIWFSINQNGILPCFQIVSMLIFGFQWTKLGPSTVSRCHKGDTCSLFASC